MNTEIDAQDVHWMRQALQLADRAQKVYDEVPVGAVLIDAQGRVVGEGWNLCITRHDPTAHAEIMALREAGRLLRNYRLPGTTLYVSLEPCTMCAMALIHARVARVVFAARDPKTGAGGSVFDVLGDRRHNHRIQVHHGILADEASAQLRQYFRNKRQRARQTKNSLICC